MSIKEFGKKLFNYQDYQYLRLKKPFGSAVNPFSGEIDVTPYAQVTYSGDKGEDYTLEDIAGLIGKNRHVVLLGAYGTGKSRCVQEVFRILSNNTDKNFQFPIAINLKENWGLKRAAEIITRHLSDLGLSGQIDYLMKIYKENSVCFLLDGFDEIGAQTWSDNPEKLKDIRYVSLQGVRNLVEDVTGGVLIVGREHYFNSDEEMIKCLGLSKKNPVIIRCKTEFSTQEMESYLTDRKINISVPSWLPKRPLICQVVAEFNIVDAEKIFSSSEGEIEFWELLINTICEREAKINPVLDPIVIKKVLTRLSRISRCKVNDYGPITLQEIYRAFEDCTGIHTTDETAIMLQRLPGLGRIGPESLDRQFVDIYLLDGLRAEDLVDSIGVLDLSIIDENWQNPLRFFGLRYVGAKLLIEGNRQAFSSYFNKASNRRNKILLGDIVASMAKLSDLEIDFNNCVIDGTIIAELDLSIAIINNIKFTDSIIEVLNIENNLASNVYFSKCIIMQLSGVSSLRGLPLWIEECSIEKYQTVHTVSRIRDADFNAAQLILLTFIRKLFLQPGSARKESALLRGLGDAANKKLAEKIIKILIKEDIVSTADGQEGLLYVPNRSKAQRMKQIMDRLSLSDDRIWHSVSQLGSK
jgi:energy-coupling factor transporter ATP-binding protein EcfA2